MDDGPRSRWEQLAGRVTGDAYAEHFARLAEGGQDVHGEATFCAGLVTPPARVLDAGCGTGRVAIRLAELGYDTVGVDLDPAMLDVARRHAPDLTWSHGDLAVLPEDVRARSPYDLVVLAGNVVPLLAPGTLAAALEGLAGMLAPDGLLAGNVVPLLAPGTLAAALEGLADALAPAGLLVTGFGTDRAHLPPGCPVTPLEEYDAHADAAGLTRTHRFGTWDAEPFDPGGGYAVSVHRRS